MPTLTELTFYPIKSCSGISLREATLTATGLMSKQIYDREWMIVDAQGEFLTQREYPGMSLITPRIKTDMLEVNAPGMPPLEIPLDLSDPDEAPILNIRIWDDAVKAYDCDEMTADWFSKILGTACRLARFHPRVNRMAEKRWTNGVDASTLFSDGFPILVISEASLNDLNQRLRAQGRDALPMNRFRPNIVIDGIGAFEEDYADSIRIGSTVIKPVKPCPRCKMPSIDQATGLVGPDPLDILQTYRANPQLDGGITLGMNAILLQGEGQILRVGETVDVELAF